MTWVFSDVIIATAGLTDPAPPYGGAASGAAKVMLYSFKEFLVDNGWTVKYSNGLDGDNWSSWTSVDSVVLKGPNTGNELLIQFKKDTRTTNYEYAMTIGAYTWKQYYQDPTYTLLNNHFLNFGIYTDYKNYTYTPWSQPTCSYDCKFMVDTEDDTFIIFGNTDGFVLGVLKIANPSPSCGQDYIVLRAGGIKGAKTTGHFKSSEFRSDLHNFEVTAIMVHPYSDVFGSVFCSIFVPSIYYVSSGNNFLESGDLGRDPINNSVTEFPLHMFYPGGGFVTGRVKDVNLVSTGACASGDKLSALEINDRYILGNFAIPWDNT